MPNRTRREKTTLHNQTASHLRLLCAVAAAANEANSLERALRIVLPSLGRSLGWPVAHAYLPGGEDRTEFVSSGIWYLSQPDRFDEFRTRTEAAGFPIGVGLPGRVVETGRAEWIEDLRGNPQFYRVSEGDDCPLVSGVAAPVLAGSAGVAMIEIFADERRTPDVLILELLEHVGMLLGRLWEREEASRRLREEVARASAARLEHELHARLLQRTLASLREAVLVVGPERTIVECNPAACRVFGYEQGELRGASTRVLHLDDESFERFAQITKADLERDGISELEFEMRRKDGSIFRSDHTVALLDRSDTSGGVVSVVRDISEKRALEEQLATSQRMEALGQLAGGVAHDFNNLLTVIRGNTELLDRDAPIPDAAKVYLEEIVHAADRAAELTGQLLAFGRGQVMTTESVQLCRVVRTVDKMLRRVIGEDVDLALELEEGGARVEIDPAQIEQALLNLAANARDAMPEGGRLTIRTCDVEVDRLLARRHDGLSPGPHVVLEVEDTGVGIPADIRERIFEPLFSTKPPGEGTGLGLATVFGIVRQSGGDVAVESEPGRGSTFSLYFPVSGAESEPPQGRSPDSDPVDPSGPGRRVLLVEDDRAVRAVVTRMLESSGHEVVGVEDAESARELLESDPTVELVISDTVLPGRRGTELVAWLREARPEVPAILVSGYDAELEGRVVPGVPRLPKPLSAQQLARAIEEVFRDA